MITGYNTASKAEQSTYDQKKLCRIIGGGLLLLTILMAVNAFNQFELPPSISWLMPWSIFTVVAAMLILSNTICKRKA